MRAIISIAINTFRESIRNKVLYTIFLFAVLLIITGNFLVDISLHNDKRVFFDVGMGILSTFGLLLSIFTGTSLIYKEIDKKTIYLILTKPVSRSQFLIGKMSGMILSVHLVLFLMFIIFLLESFLIGTGMDVNLFKAMILVLLEIIIIISVTTLLSSFSTPFITGMLTTGIVLIGRLLPDLKQIIVTKYQDTSLRDLTDQILQIFPQLYLYVPNGHSINGNSISITSDFITWHYVMWTALYAVLYSSVMLIISSFLFKRRDLT